MHARVHVREIYFLSFDSGIRQEISSRILYDVAWLPILHIEQPRVFAFILGLVHVDSCTSLPYSLPWCIMVAVQCILP